MGRISEVKPVLSSYKNVYICSLHFVMFWTSQGIKLTAAGQNCETYGQKQQYTYWDLYFGRWRLTCSFLPLYVINSTIM